jgi:hypothetical protein
MDSRNPASVSKHGKPCVQNVGEGWIVQTRGDSVARESDEASISKHGKPCVQRADEGRGWLNRSLLSLEVKNNSFACGRLSNSRRRSCPRGLERRERGRPP